MDDVHLRIRDLVERAAEPVVPHEAVARANGRTGGGRRVLVAALVGFVALLGLVAVVTSREPVTESPVGDAPAGNSSASPEGCTWSTERYQSVLGSLLEEGLTLGVVAQYESEDPDYENLLFLSADVDGAAFDGADDVATWASNGAGNPALLSVVPVNELARSISTRVGPSLAPVPPMETHGAVESQRCLAPSPVPDLLGLDQATAMRLLTSNSFEPAFAEEPHPVVALGEVLRTDPPARTSVEPGSTVTVVVSGVDDENVLPGRIVEGLDSPLPVSLSSATFRLSETRRSYTWVSDPIDPSGTPDIGVTIEVGSNGDAGIDRQGFEIRGEDRVYVVEFSAAGEDGARGSIVVGTGLSSSDP